MSNHPVNVKTRAAIKLEEMEKTIHYQEALLAANHVIAYDDSIPHPDFDEACDKFRRTCTAIRELLGVYRFLGSYEEIELYKDCEELKTDAGRALKEDLTLYNQLCIHEGNKIGLPPPEWFKKCWGIEG